VTALSQSVVSYAGTFSPVVPGGAFNLVFGAPVPTAGASIQVVLSGQSSYAGTTSIRTGSDLVAANSAAFGTSSVSLDGGRLALPAGVNLANPLSITAGTLAGEGSVTTASTIPVGAGVVLAPGSDLPGTLTFAAATGFNGAVLSLLGGGSYSWKIGDATDTGAGWDRVIVTGAGGATVAASPVSPFKVTMSPVGAGGLLAGTIGAFDPLIPYAWPILTASSITGFASGAFVVDSSAFATLAPDYKFSVGLVTDPLGSSLVLNYNPAAVPEPSTWVMLLTGAGFGVIWLGRRRRR
jgi:hypothetical protein